MIMTVLADALSHVMALSVGLTVGIGLWEFMTRSRVAYCRSIEQRLDLEDAAALKELATRYAIEPVTQWQLPNTGLADVTLDLTAHAARIYGRRMPALAALPPGVSDEPPGRDGDRVVGDEYDEDGWPRGLANIVDEAMDVFATPTVGEADEERALVPLPAGMGAGGSQSATSCGRGELVIRAADRTITAAAGAHQVAARTRRAAVSAGHAIGTAPAAARAWMNRAWTNRQQRLNYTPRHRPPAQPEPEERMATLTAVASSAGGPT